MTVLGCPSAATLSAFADHELTADEVRTVQAHLDECVACRETLLDWIDVEDDLVGVMAECPAPETLVAFTENLLTADERVRTTMHLETCAHCRLEAEAMADELADTPAITPGRSPVWHHRVAAAATAFARALIRPGPVLSAVTATALVVIALARLLPREELTQLSGFQSTVREAVRLRSAAELPTQRAEVELEPGRTNLDERVRRAAPEVRRLDTPPSSVLSPPVERLMQPGPAALSGGSDAKKERGQKDGVQRHIERDAVAKVAPPSAAAPKTAGDLSATNSAAQQSSIVSQDTLVDKRLQLSERAAQPLPPGSAEPVGTPRPLVGHEAPNPESRIIATVRVEEIVARIKDENGWTLAALTNRRSAWFLSTDVPAGLPPASHGGVSALQ